MSGRVAIDLAAEPGLAVLRLDNAARRNAISAAMWEAIGAFARTVGERTDVRVVLVEGTAGLFSAGADISGFAEGRAGGAGDTSYDDLVEATCRLVEAIPQPVIAAVEGICFGAGASLAASCDLRVASAEASFAVPAARLGLGYDIRGIARFRRVFGPGGTAALLFTADRMPAPEAHMLGAVQRIVPVGETAAVARAIARRIASNAPLTLRAAKTALRALAAEAASTEALADEARALAARADASADYAEGRAAFSEKRPPRFTGT
ncbi:MAG: enoyl-CoA hydratase/isomerase family protein [Rhizobiales bacterium]|nr:enoyl-CoA hydratase/isomerase family protein [Hyphomicrobiales bacterium]